MNTSRLALIIESDPNAMAQMRRVLAGMKVSVMATADETALTEALDYLRSKRASPDVIIARVTLPSGSGIRLLEEAAEVFPEARHLVVSHYPKNLLYSVPRFVEHCKHFLQEEFTDDQFRSAVEQTLEKVLRAG